MRHERTPSGIGSVLPLAASDPACPPGHSVWEAWTQGRPFAAFRSARSALAAALRARRVDRLWLPAYACPALVEAAGATRVAITWFAVDAALEPDAEKLASALRPGDAALAVDYFGRAPGAAFQALVRARPDVLWIEDRAQALDPGVPPWGELILYSPRKLVGVGDGGLIVGETSLTAPEPDGIGEAFAAAERARAADPGGERPDTWFPLFRAREAALTADLAPISRLTRDILRATPIAPAVEARGANYAALLAHLSEFALWPGTPPGFAPLAFPILIEDAAAAQASLAAERLWCARHWAKLPSPADRFPEAHGLARELLSLPCDPGYGADDMARVAEAVRRLTRRLSI